MRRRRASCSSPGPSCRRCSLLWPGRLSDRVEARYVATAGMVFCALGLFALIFLGETTPYWYVVGALCLLGLGIAFFATPIIHAIMGSVDKSRVGMASATVAAMRQAGMNMSMGVATMVIALLVGQVVIVPATYPRASHEHPPDLLDLHRGLRRRDRAGVDGATPGERRRGGGVVRGVRQHTHPSRRRGEARMIVREILAKSVLSTSKIYDYTVNPYSGCAHSCSYCYARFMGRFTGHQEPWGEFVDAKINAPDLLAKEIRRKTPGTVWVSGVCDPYQPVEARYELTRQCVGIVTSAGWPLVVQTRSPLVVRDIDILSSSPQVEVGLSVTTADDRVRRLFEPKAPPIAERLEALARLHRAGIKTFVMIAPLLPGAERLPALLAGTADHVLIDRMNYGYGSWVYRKYALEDYQTEGYFRATAENIARDLDAAGTPCRVVF